MGKRFKTFKKIAKAARKTLHATLLSASLMLATKAVAKPVENLKSFSARLMAGSYAKGKTPFVGLGASTSLRFKRMKIGATLDTIFPDFKNAELDQAKLDISFPVNQYFAFSPFIFRSQYYGGIPFSAGVVFHIPKLNLHFAPHWIQGINALPLFISWTPKMSNLDLMVKVIVNTLHPINSKPAPLIGGEIKFSIKLIDKVNAYGKTFLMSAKNEENKMFIGAVSSQGGLEFGL
jgi:hypothetical protein